MSFLSAALAQGTIEFSATLFAGDPGLRDRSQLIEVGFARFTLTGERSFSGYANMDVYFGATGFHVSDSSQPFEERYERYTTGRSWQWTAVW